MSCGIAKESETNVCPNIYLFNTSPCVGLNTAPCVCVGLNWVESVQSAPPFVAGTHWSEWSRWKRMLTVEQKESGGWEGRV